MTNLLIGFSIGVLVGAIVVYVTDHPAVKEKLKAAFALFKKKEG